MEAYATGRSLPSDMRCVSTAPTRYGDVSVARRSSRYVVSTGALVSFCLTVSMPVRIVMSTPTFSLSGGELSVDGVT